MKKYIFVLAAGFMAVAQVAVARDQVRIVGSATVFPFVAAAAENYAEKTGGRAPIVESIGTGAGFLEFCKGVGDRYPDIATASRKIVPAESDICAKNRVGEIVEIPIGMDGIIIATSAESVPFKLTREQLFAALAKNIIKDGKIIENPNKLWSDIDASLPKNKIDVYGPSTTSGTRDAFVEIVFDPVCEKLLQGQKQFSKPEQRKAFCHAVREDGAYIEAGENDNLIVQKLTLNHNAVGIFGYNYLEQNLGKVQALPIDGVAADYENIADGSYPVARLLYVYVKRANIPFVKDLVGFVRELTSDGAISEDGYLADKGLISLPEAELKKLQKMVASKF